VSKYLYPAPATVEIKVLIQENNKRPVEYFGNANTRKLLSMGASSSNNVFRDFSVLVERAKLDAVYQYSKDRSLKFSYSHNYTVQIVDYDIKYNTDLVVTKRVVRKRKDGSTVYYSKAIDKRTGKQIGKQHLWRKPNV